MLDRPFTIGGGGGFGGLQFRDANGNTQSTSAAAYTFRLGFGLHPGLILMWDVEGAVASDAQNSYQQTAHLAALQLFLTNRLFLKGGLGAARVDQVSGPYVWEGRWGVPPWAASATSWSRDGTGRSTSRRPITGARYKQTADNQVRELDQLVAGQLRDQLLLGPADQRLAGRRSADPLD